MTTTSASTDTTPRVWISAFGAYNEGFLIGRWVDAIEAADITAKDLFEGSPYHWADDEELWCFDIENMLTRSEMSPQEATRQAEVIDSVDEHLRPAFYAWAASGDVVEDGDGLPSVSDFEERYAGHWDSFQQYSDDYLESTGMLSEIPEEVTRHFDYKSYARELEQDFTTCDAPGGGVFIFHSF